MNSIGKQITEKPSLQSSMSFRRVPSAAPEPTRREHQLRAMREAFDMVDTDHSGSISVEEFGVLLRLQGEDLTHEDVTRILQEIDVDGDATNLTFDEFVELLDGIEFPDGKIFAHDIVAAFARQAKEKSQHFQSKDPLFVTLQNRDYKFSTQRNARMKLATIIDGNVTQIVVMSLILVDVICVLGELLLVATKCPCAAYGDDYGYYSYYSYANNTNSSYDNGHRRELEVGEAVVADLVEWGGRGLREAGPGMVHRLVGWMAEATDGWMPGYDAPGWWEDWKDLEGRRLAGGGCEEGTKVYSHDQHVWEHSLHVVSVSILWIFAAQIAALIALYGCEFFRNLFYVLDLVVIAGALVLESMHITAGGLFVLLLSWRGLRVVHGLMSSIELQHKRQEERLTQERWKFMKMVLSTRRQLGERSIYFHDFHNRLTGNFSTSESSDQAQSQSQLQSQSQSKLDLEPQTSGSTIVPSSSAYAPRALEERKEASGEEGPSREQSSSHREPKRRSSSFFRRNFSAKFSTVSQDSQQTASTVIREMAAKKPTVFMSTDGLLYLKGASSQTASVQEVDLTTLSEAELREHLMEALAAKKIAEDMYLELYNTLQSHRDNLGETVHELQNHELHHMTIGKDTLNVASQSVRSMTNAIRTLSVRSSPTKSLRSLRSSMTGRASPVTSGPPKTIAEFGGEANAPGGSFRGIKHIKMSAVTAPNGRDDLTDTTPSSAATSAAATPAPAVSSAAAEPAPAPIPDPAPATADEPAAAAAAPTSRRLPSSSVEGRTSPGGRSSPLPPLRVTAGTIHTDSDL